MTKSKIKFYQEGPKEPVESDKIDITWKVVNDSNFDLKKVKGVSQFTEHDFENIPAHSNEEYSFTIEIPSIEAIKEDFGEDATISNPFLINAPVLSFEINNDTFSISSNSLEISF